VPDQKAIMTDAQRINALLDNQKPDRVPVWHFAYAGFAMLEKGYTIAQIFLEPEKALEAERLASRKYRWVSNPTIGYAAYGSWEFGGQLKLPTGEYDQAPSVIRYPVETEGDAWSLKLPDIEKAGIIPGRIMFQENVLREKPENEPFQVICCINEPFHTAGNICGLERLCRWLIKKPEIAHHLLHLATDHSSQVAQYWAKKFGTKNALIRSADAISSNQVISPKLFETFALPYAKELHEKILTIGYKNIYVHICGEQNLNLPYWAEVPMGNPGFVSVGHEVDIMAASKYFPRDIILGNINPAIVQNSTVDEVYRLTKQIIEHGKNCSRGYIFSTGCDLPPRAPAENVMAMTRATEDAGFYSQTF